jgi:hypothetical protein
LYITSIHHPASPLTYIQLEVRQITLPSGWQMNVCAGYKQFGIRDSQGCHVSRSETELNVGIENQKALGVPHHNPAPSGSEKGTACPKPFYGT